jgi:hypothetical protein
LKHFVQAAQRSQCVARHRASLLHSQLIGNRRDVFSFDCRVLGVKSALGIYERQCVRAVALFQAAHFLADSGDCPGAVRAKHIRESRFGAEHFGKLALAFIWVPDADARRFNAEKDFIRPGFGHRKRLHLNGFDAAELVKRSGAHCCSS